MALIGLGIGVLLEIGKPQPRAVGEAPHLLLLVQFCTQGSVELPAALDGLDQLGALAPDHQADGVLLIPGGVGEPFSQDPVGLAAATGATVEDLEDRAGDEGDLGTFLGFPEDYWIRWGACRLCHSLASSIGSGMRTMKVWRISPVLSWTTVSFQPALVFSQKMAAVTDWAPSPSALRYKLSATRLLALVWPWSSSWR